MLDTDELPGVPIMEAIQVSDFMQHRPVTFRAEEGIYEALQAFVRSGMTAGVVLDAQRHVIGFLSEQDCLHEGLEACYQCEQRLTLRELMHTPVDTVQAEESIVEVTQRMIREGRRCYPVVDEDNRLLGLITRHDIIRALATDLASCFGHHHPSTGEPSVRLDD